MIRCIRNIDFNEAQIIAFLDNDSGKWGNIIEKAPFIKAPVIGIGKLAEYEYDYIAVASLRYAGECLEQLTQSGIPKEKILLVCDDSIWPVMLEVDRFGNNAENNIVFTNNYYAAYRKLLDRIWEGYDRENHVFRFKELTFSDEALQDQDIFFPEFRDLLQEYVFGEAVTPFNEGPYEWGEVTLREGDVVFDCGANIGIFTAYAAQKAQGGQVYAFEPYERAARQLKKNTSRYANVNIVERALSDKAETVSMSVGDQLGNSSIISMMGDKYITVETDTIDHIMKEYGIGKLDFIKADIEGAEREMLWGARESISRFKPRISICTYHLKDDREMLEAIIKNIDKRYVVVHKWRKLFAWVPEDQKEGGISE